MNYFETGVINPNPSMDLLNRAVRAYDHYTVCFHKDRDGISAWMVVPNGYSTAIASWALGKDALNPSKRRYVILRGRVDETVLLEWTHKTRFMEFTQPECMFDGSPKVVPLTNAWEQVGEDGVHVPAFPEDILETVLFVSGMGLVVKDFVPAKHGFSDAYNVGVDLIYARTAGWESAFANAVSGAPAVSVV